MGGRRRDGDRLQAFDDKDYSEEIEFPVELVDRDGVVRRYSYEESLAVYHRRIQSAPWRYDDDTLIRAEIGHCTRRIDQIKRSWRERSRKDEPQAVASPRAALGDAWGAIAAYYRDELARRGLVAPDELPLVVHLVQDDPDGRVYHVACRGRGQLLTVYPFDRAGDADPHEAFFRARAAYRQLATAGMDVERLLFEREGESAGYLLTGVDELPAGLADACEAGREAPSWAPGTGEPPPDDEGPFAQGVRALKAEQHAEAIEAFRETVERNPYHRDAYLALLTLLDDASRFGEAELYGEMAVRYLPDDPLVRQRRAVGLVRQGHIDAAIAAFDEASERTPGASRPPYFAAQLLVARGRDLDGARRRLKRAVAASDADAPVLRALRRVEGLIVARRGLRAVGAAAACGFAVLAGLGSRWAWPGLVAGLLLLAGAPAMVGALGRWVLQRDDDD